MILAVNEMVTEMPKGATFEFTKNDKGWPEQIAILGMGFIVPVLTAEIDHTCLICNSDGTPIRVIEPSILG